MKTCTYRLMVSLMFVVLTFNLAVTPLAKADGFYSDSWMNDPRVGHTATVLPNGTLLVAGGYNGSLFWGPDDQAGPLSSAEIYSYIPNSNTGSWAYTGFMNDPRYYHTATLLTNGLVLVAGGENKEESGTFGGVLSNAELYDPSSGTWTYTGSMNDARQQHTATLLPSGLVLVAGGDDGNGHAITNAELYNPATGTWTVTGSMNYPREGHTATLLPNGEVLVAGGCTNGVGAYAPGEVANPPPSAGALASAELYNPSTGTWTITGSMISARGYHTATLLPNSWVWLAGGLDNGNALNTTEFYNPVTGTWIPNSRVLNTARYGHAAAMLPDGRVLLAGGWDSSGNGISSGEVYYPINYGQDNADSYCNYTSNNLTVDARGGATASVIYGYFYPRAHVGRVIIAGGSGNPGNSDPDYQDVDRYDCLNNDYEIRDLGDGGDPSNIYKVPFGCYWMVADWMSVNRGYHTATLLTNGDVLVAGGYDVNFNAQASAELYNSGTTWTWTNQPSGAALAGALAGIWTNTGSMNTPRSQQTATLLTNGWVLVAGGWDDSSFDVAATAELYNPATGTWINTGSMNDARTGHTATLLTNGEVLVAGGWDDSSFDVVATAELYNPATGTWTHTGSMNGARVGHTATLLSNGEVLVAGGWDDSSYDTVATAELYNPATGTWANTGSLNTPRAEFTATLWPPFPVNSASILAAGGVDDGNVLTSAEIYNVANGTWTTTASMNWPRWGHTATSLPGVPFGQNVLVAGGSSDDQLPTAEIYSFSSHQWTITNPMDADRAFHTATLLPNGQVLVTGGSSDDGPARLPYAELYVGLPLWGSP